MSRPEYIVETFGDRAVLVRFRAEPSPQLTAVLTGVAKAAAGLPEVVDAWPGLTTVLIETARRTEAEAAIPGLIAEVAPAEGALHEVSLTYDGEDFGWVCKHLGIEPEKLVQLHSGTDYDVRLLGSPGFVYLSDVPPEIAVPRMEEPRQSVPGGSVGIGGRQTGIYGLARPGGWRIIGRAVEVPSLVPGDRVRFVPQ